MSQGLRIVGRSSSHYTRLARLFAEAAQLTYEFQPIYDMTQLDPAVYGGHPALKLPVLHLHGGGVLWGTENICRRLAALSPDPRRFAWAEDSEDLDLLNAQELVWHGMQAQVQLAFGLEVARLPADNLYFVKAASGLKGALAWLDERLPALLERLPPRDLSLLEASLFCLVDHIAFRRTVETAEFEALNAYAQAFGRRPAALATSYGFDRRADAT